MPMKGDIKLEYEKMFFDTNVLVPARQIYLGSHTYEEEYGEGSDAGKPKVDGNHLSDVFNLNRCTNCVIDGFYICNSYMAPNSAGIYLKNCENCLISNNIIYNNFYGIFFEFSFLNDVIKNMIDGQSKSGIYLDSSDENLIYKNCIHNSGTNGISILDSSQRNYIRSNDISYNTLNAIKILTADYFDWVIGQNIILKNNICNNGEPCEQLGSFRNHWGANYWGESNNFILGLPPIWDKRPVSEKYKINCNE